MFETEIIYHGDCHHIFCDDIRSDNCLKRYFDCKNPVTGIPFRVAICNDYLRLIVRQEFAKQNKESNDYTNYTFNYKWHVEDIIKDILLKYFQYEHYKIDFSNNYYKKELSERHISNLFFRSVICQRPYVYFDFNVMYAIQLYMNGHYNLEKDIINSIRGYVNTVNSIKKYKTLSLEIERQLRKIEHTVFGNKEYKQIFINELFINILKLKL